MTKPQGGFDKPSTILEEMDARSREIFKIIVDSYLETGDPMGSKLLANSMSDSVSSATIRNVMADLEAMGLIYSPHTSAGRLPTNTGMRFFVDSFLEIGDLTKEDRNSIDAQVKAQSSDKTLDSVLLEASQMLSGLSSTASIIATTKQNLRLKQIEFVRLEETKALVVIVGENGHVENRIIELPAGTTASTLTQATNYLNANISGLTLDGAHQRIHQLHNAARKELDSLAQGLVDEGLAVWSGASERDAGRLIVSGHSNLLNNFKATEDLERVRQLFEELEERDNLMKLLSLADSGKGVRIFIGSENRLFSSSGSSLIVSPYKDDNQNIIGALGVIGPTRLNYARIVPMVDYTARVVGKLLGR